MLPVRKRDENRIWLLLPFTHGSSGIGLVRVTDKAGGVEESQFPGDSGKEISPTSFQPPTLAGACRYRLMRITSVSVPRRRAFRSKTVPYLPPSTSSSRGWGDERLTRSSLLIVGRASVPVIFKGGIPTKHSVSGLKRGTLVLGPSREYGLVFRHAENASLRAQ